MRTKSFDTEEEIQLEQDSFEVSKKLSVFNFNDVSFSAKHEQSHAHCISCPLSFRKRQMIKKQ